MGQQGAWGGSKGERRGKADRMGEIWGVVVLERQRARAKRYVAVGQRGREVSKQKAGEQESGKRKGELQLLAVAGLALHQSQSEGDGRT